MDRRRELNRAARLTAAIFLLASVLAGASAVDAAAPRVIDNLFLRDAVGENPLLRHNIPNLQLTIDGTEHRADFRDHFAATGGLERWGLPTSEVLVEEEGSLTQYYQRGVVDYHRRPDLGDIWVLERRLAWDYVGGGRAGSTDQGTEPDILNPHPGTELGPWGHRVSDLDISGQDVGFGRFFHRLGGVSSFGLPKTDARPDTGSPGTLLAPGSTPGFVRQYFQAAVFEYHPADERAPVKLSLLGDVLRDQSYPDQYWYSLVPFRGAAPLAPGDPYELLEVVPPSATPAPANTLPPGELYAFGSRTAGLLVFDGEAWRTVEVANSELLSDTVRAVTVDPRRGLWLGTDGGAYYFPYFNPAGNVAIDAARFGLAANTVLDVDTKSGQIVLLALQDAGLAQYIHPAFGSTRGTLSAVPVGRGGLPSRVVRAAVLANDFPPQMWVATDAGLAYFDGRAWTTVGTERGLPSPDIAAVAVAGSEIWVGTRSNGVAVALSGLSGQFSSYGLRDGLPSLNVRDILAAADGSVWVATDAGLAVISPGEFDFRPITARSTDLPDDDVRALAEAADGSILIATAGGGARYDPVRDSWQVWDSASGLLDEDLLAVTVIPAVA